MLKHLYIENITIIKKICLDFSEGLNVIIGETGSGKSVVLDSIELVTGGRAKAEIVRTGEQKAIIIAEFEFNSHPELLEILSQNSISLTDNTITLKRIIHNDGKSSAFICDMPVTLNLINKISTYLIEINGQFAQGRLFEVAEHLKMLDEYSILQEELIALKLLFLEYSEANKEYNKISEIKQQSIQNYDYYLTLITDLENLQFIEDEENKLLEKKRILLQQGSLDKTLQEITEMDQNLGLSKAIKKIAKNLEFIKAKTNKELNQITITMEQSAIDFCEGLDYMRDIVKRNKNPEIELENIEERLYQIKQICRKYNITSAGIFDLLNKAQENIKISQNMDLEIAQAKKNMDQKWHLYIKIAKNISQKRSEGAKQLTKELQLELTALKMEHAKMKINLIEDEKLSSFYGINTLCFMASTNPGMPIMPINKIASGGELSRFMLAFKAVMSRKTKLPAIIFDEIDSGTSGIVASVIADYLYNIGQKTQVLAVTHSHQVVKRGNSVIKISKQTDGIETIVNAHHLDLKEIANEVGVMINGVN